MRRRDFAGLLGVMATRWSSVAVAQMPPKRPLVGALFGTRPEISRPYLNAFLEGMGQLGYVEGQSFRFIALYAEGRLDRQPALASELVQLNPDVMLAANSAATFALREANQSIPLVSVTLVDPIGSGLAFSDARPGGQVTGLRWNLETLVGKQLELLSEVVPSLSRVGVFAVPTAPWLRQEAEAAANIRGIKLLHVEVRAPEDLEGAFEAVKRVQAQAMLVDGSPMFFGEHRRIIRLASAARLPVIYGGWAEIPRAGGLMSYGVNLRESFRRTAFYVDRILRGAAPGDLPLELPTFQLVINLKTANALGLMVPPTLLALADEVVE